MRNHNTNPDSPALGGLASTYVGRILRARVYDVAKETPLDHAARLSRRLGNNIWLKREDLQPVFSFKLRGAYNKIAQLSPEVLARGVICSSAGNHAQGVALAARKLGARAIVVMPTSTPSIKVEAVRALEAEIVLEGETYDDAYARAIRLAESHDLAFVHPFADPDVIAGQGTIGVELTRQWKTPPKAIFVPVGGGGLVAGIGCYIKHLYPEIKVIGVEPVDAASMHQALESGGPIELDHVGLFADGVAVRRVSDHTYALAREVVDEIILVSTDEICAAIKDIFEDVRVIMEPAGALAIAGLKRCIEDTGAQGGSYIAIASGANVNFDRLGHVTERAELGEHREALLAVEIPEQRGAFLKFCEVLGARNITEFNYRYSPSDQARIFVGVALQGERRDTSTLIDYLKTSGYSVLDLSDNELAKLHLRHMIGGRGTDIRDELIYRFEFPEHPGALLRFLESIGTRWNISLFHYRNHGSDYGRVLAGIQVPADERAELAVHLANLGYVHYDETRNAAYRSFLDPKA